MVAVLYVGASKVWGGGEVYLAHLIRGLGELGWADEVTVLVRDVDEVTAGFRELNGLDRLETYPSRLKLASRIRELLDGMPPGTILHINGRVPLAASVLASLGKRTTPVVASAHLPFARTFLAKHNQVKDHLWHGLLHLACDATICVSQQIQDELVTFPGLPRERLPIVRTCVEPERYGDAEAGRAMREEMGIGLDAFVVVQVSRLTSDKGQDVAIRALSRLVAEGQDAHLVLVGQGPARRSLEALRRELGVEDRVHLLGFVDELPPALATGDVAVLPSMVEGGFPFVLLEAMASRMPFVASAVGDIPLLAQRSKAGYVIQPQSVDALASHLLVLARADTRRRELGEQARRWVEANMRPEHMTQRTIEVYEDVLDRA